MSLFGQSWRERMHGNHICGLYYRISCGGQMQKTYLPQVELQAHATILATISRTVLTQTFINPEIEKGIREVRYTFPLYEGVSVVGFTCQIGDRTIIGEVKEKEKARAIFKEAVVKGQTAGLFEQLPEASDVFTTTIGNIPPGAKVIIKITYLGELKHDMEVDGIRFTIPNVICPRYGNYPGELLMTSATDVKGNGISIIVDADMADGSFIQKMQSPTHPISMTMGTTSLAPNAEPTMAKASATLTLGTAELDKDFVLQVIAKNTGIPRAILEDHPTIPNHRALMATLVPKFALPPEKPELVFVCDRSGSMSGSRITLVVQALKVFLKSLPVGVKFNICSFGSSHSFLWERSVTYSQQTLEDAINHANSFQADYGGTEMLSPLRATIDQRYKDMPLDIMVLTDGETWNQHALFSYLNESVIESKAPIRLFTLGIGNGVSHALIEGIANAGNGFSQTVGEGEKMDTKVVRMLKGALSPHVNDYTLEVKYSNTTPDEKDDDFEIIEKVTDSLNVNLNLGNEEKKKTEMVRDLTTAIRISSTDYYQKKLILLFDPSADPDMEDPLTYDESGEQKYAHLPKIVTPKIIQAPQNVPSLFAFNRTTVYLLLGPDAPKAMPKSIVLRGTSVHGPLELEIPIQIMDQPGEMIHQLAAKKVISELEVGRGWLSEAKDDSGTLVKKSFEGRFSDMVEREAVRLGVMFQVGGKWCSFVAVEANQQSDQEKGKEAEGWKWIEDEEQAKYDIAHGKSSDLSSLTSACGPSMGSYRSTSSVSFESSDSTDNFSYYSNDEDSRGRELGACAKDLEIDVDASESGDDDDGYRLGVNRFLFGTESDSDEDDERVNTDIQSDNLHYIAQGLEVPKGEAKDEVQTQKTEFDRSASSAEPIIISDHISSNNNDSTRIANVYGIDRLVQARQEAQRHFMMQQQAAQQQAAQTHGHAHSNLPPSHPFVASNGNPPMNFGQTPAPSGHGLFGVAKNPFASRNSHLAEANTSSNTFGAVHQPSNNLFGQLAPGSSSSSVPFGSPSAVSNAPMAFQGVIEAPQQSNSLFGLVPPPPTGAHHQPPGGLFASGSSFGTLPQQEFCPTTQDWGKPPLQLSNQSGANPSENPALQDYQMQLMVLEQQNKNRRLMTRQEDLPAVPSHPNMLQEQTAASPFRNTDPPRSGLFGANPPQMTGFGSSAPFGTTGLAAATAPSASCALFGAPAPSATPKAFGSAASSGSSALFGAPAPSETPNPFGSSAPRSSFVTSKTPEDLTLHLISLQSFEGFWDAVPSLLASLQLERLTLQSEYSKAGVDEKVFITALVVAVFELVLKAHKGSWELVVEKAKAWLVDQGVGDVEELVAKAGILAK
jgi:hypothetical protein